MGPIMKSVVVMVSGSLAGSVRWLNRFSDGLRGYLKSFMGWAFMLVSNLKLLSGSLFVEINSVVYTFGFCLKTRLSSYPALSRMSIDTGNPLCS